MVRCSALIRRILRAASEKQSETSFISSWWKAMLFSALRIGARIACRRSLPSTSRPSAAISLLVST